MTCKTLKLLLFLFLFGFSLLGYTCNAQSISGNTYFYDQQFNVSYGSFPAWSNGFGESGTFPTSTYHTVAKSVNGPYINTVRDIYVSNTDYSFTSGNTYKLSLIFNKGSYLLSSSSALYGLTVNRNLSLCRIYGQSAGNMTCSIDWSVTDESMIATIYMHTTLGGNGFELQIGNLNAGTNMIVYNSSFDYSQGIKLTSADIIKDNSATDSLINNQNQNTQNIINNNNQNTQTIINNQNENTEKEIESQKVCKFIDKSSTISDGFLTSTGSISGGSGFGVTDYYSVSSSDTISILDSWTGGIYTCFYNVNKSLIGCVSTASLSNGDNVNIPSNSSFVRFSLNRNINKPQFQLCRNGNQALSDDINDLNNTLKDDSLDDFPSGGGGGTYFDDINQSSQTPISDLLLLPLNLLNAINNSINNQCTPYTLPFDFTGGNNTLTFPCLNLESYVGSSLWGVIDGLFVIFMFYNIAMLIIRFFEDWTSARDTFDILFKPEGGGF